MIAFVFLDLEASSFLLFAVFTFHESVLCLNLVFLFFALVFLTTLIFELLLYSKRFLMPSFTHVYRILLHFDVQVDVKVVHSIPCVVVQDMSAMLFISLTFLVNEQYVV